MGEALKYQLRLTLSDPFAKVARNHPDDPSIAPLTQLLRRRGLQMPIPCLRRLREGGGG
jgi:hypothetical protein